MKTKSFGQKEKNLHRLNSLLEDFDMGAEIQEGELDELLKLFNKPKNVEEPRKNAPSENLVKIFDSYPIIKMAINDAGLGAMVKTNKEDLLYSFFKAAHALINDLQGKPMWQPFIEVIQAIIEKEHFTTLSTFSENNLDGDEEEIYHAILRNREKYSQFVAQ